MPLIIQELLVEVQMPGSEQPFPEYGQNADENLQKMQVQMEMAEERRKRLSVD